MGKRDERRLLENEVIFKQINKDIDGFLHDMDVEKVLRAPFYCECSDLHCTQRIEISAAAYEAVHRNPKHFILVNGHEEPTIEKVLERRSDYTIVEKLRELPTADEVTHRLKELRS
jgi:surfactin synthase thioesterase subunit